MSVAAVLVAVLSLVAPVPAPVVRPFEEPTCAWCPGHRGLRFDTTPGTPVAAPVAGRVVFAGTVAGRRWLTVLDGAGRRVTVGPLAGLVVAGAAEVRAGQRVGRSGPWLLLTVRDTEGRYLDPAPLLVARRLVPRLVPLDRVGR